MSENLKSMCRMVIMQFFIITVCAMFVIAATNTLFSGGMNYPIDATFPWVMMLTGLLGSLPSLLFFFRNEPTKKQFYIRVVIHFFAIEAVMLIEGRILGWYSTFEYMLIKVFEVRLITSRFFSFHPFRYRTCTARNR